MSRPAGPPTTRAAVPAPPALTDRAATGSVLLGAVLWGTNGTAQALAPAAATSAGIGALRAVLGGLVLAVAVWWRPRSRAPSVRHGAPSTGRRGATLGAVLLAGLGVAGYQLFFFSGVRAAGVAIGTLVAIASAPVFTGVAEILVRRRRPAHGWLPATALALAGTVLLVRPDAQSRVSPLGVVLALGAGASYVVITLAGKWLLERGWTSAEVMAAAFGIGGLLLAPLLGAVPLGWTLTPRGLTVVAWLSLATTAGGYLLYARGLRHLEPPTVTTLTLAEPLTAAALGIVVLAERPEPVALMGGGFVAAGLGLLIAWPWLARGRPGEDASRQDA